MPTEKKKTKNPAILLNNIPDDIYEKIIEIKMHLMQKQKRASVGMKETVFKAIRLANING
jgi:hypothetical protein